MLGDAPGGGDGVADVVEVVGGEVGEPAAEDDEAGRSDDAQDPPDPPARRGLGRHLGRDDAGDLASVGGQVSLADPRGPVVGDQHPRHVPGVLSLVEREEARGPRGEPLAAGRVPRHRDRSASRLTKCASSVPREPTSRRSPGVPRRSWIDETVLGGGLLFVLLCKCFS